jgi:lysophospholipase L1-like esterase
VSIAAAAAAFTAQLLVIGDSTTAGGGTTGELLVLDTADANASLTLLGTQGSGSNQHEGRSGWNATTFTTSGSPFWIGGTVDMAGYITANSFTGITHCVIALGVNDVFNAATDTALATSINGYMAGIARMVRGLRAYSGAIKIGIALTMPPSFSQDAFGANYNSGQSRARYRRNWHALIRTIQSAINTNAVVGVSMLPYSCSLATEANMPTETVAVNSRNAATVVRQSNGVHAAASGYLQLADVVWAWLKNNP